MPGLTASLAVVTAALLAVPPAGPPATGLEPLAAAEPCVIVVPIGADGAEQLPELIRDLLEVLMELVDAGAAAGSGGEPTAAQECTTTSDGPATGTSRPRTPAEPGAAEPAPDRPREPASGADPVPSRADPRPADPRPDDPGPAGRATDEPGRDSSGTGTDRRADEPSSGPASRPGERSPGSADGGSDSPKTPSSGGSGSGGEAASKESGSEESGNKDSGNKDSGKESGGKDSGEESGGKESGEESGGKDSGEESGGKESGGKESGGKESGGKESGSKESGSKESGSKDSGSKDSGSKDSGSEESGGKESGGKESGSKESGSKDSSSDGSAGEDSGAGGSGGAESGSGDEASKGAGTRDEKAGSGGARPAAGTKAPAGNTGTAEMPGDLLDLQNWFLTLPIGPAGDPDSIDQPELLTYNSEYFALTPERDGVVFRAPAGGVTTENSKYPRSELREMVGEEKAAWSNSSGTHVLETRQAITEVPPAKPEVVAAQIHDGGDDVMQIRLEGQTLVAQYADGQEQIVIDPAYQLGTPYDLRIVAADSRVTVFYNGEQKAEIARSGTSWYFKIGSYIQSNPEQGDAPDAVGEVVVYSLAIEHSGT